MLIWSISYPVCLPWRWKWEEINIGLTHHLLVHRCTVQHPAEDFDYFPDSVWPHISIIIFYILSPLVIFLSFPCCLRCPWPRFGLLWSLPFSYRSCRHISLHTCLGALMGTIMMISRYRYFFFPLHNTQTNLHIILIIDSSEEYFLIIILSKTNLISQKWQIKSVNLDIQLSWTFKCLIIFLEIRPSIIFD